MNRNLSNNNFKQTNMNNCMVVKETEKREGGGGEELNVKKGSRDRPLIGYMRHIFETKRTNARKHHQQKKSPH